MGASGGLVRGVSVVTTTWNEKENIGELICRVRSSLKGIPHEIIVVDDTSSDGTLEVARSAADVAVSKVREGQTKGLLCGMKLAKFPAIVTIDADLENSPEFIPSLIGRLSECKAAADNRDCWPADSGML